MFCRLRTFLRLLFSPRKLDSSRVVVRQLRPDDLERFFPPIELALAKKWLAMQGRGELYIAVAEVDGAPAGRRCLNVEQYAAIGAGYCFAASVLPQWRSRGIGALIDAHLAAVASKKGLRALHCVVEKSNPRARSWHERLGYRVTGERVVHWVEGDGREVTADCWELERRLNPERSA